MAPHRESTLTERNKEKPIISYKKEKSLKDILVRAKLQKKGQDT